MIKAAQGLLFCLLLTVSAPCHADQNCFLVVAGRDATADGSVIMGHNEDNEIDVVFRMRRVQRMVHQPGEFVELAGAGLLAQADTTYGYLIFEMPGKPFSHSLLNEHAVAVVSNSCPSREDRPELTDGGIGPMLRYLVAERASTACQGVKLVGSLVEYFGYSASGRTLTICDSHEAWQVAIVNGKLWCARRVPDDEVSILANSYGIHEVDMRDTLNFLGSRGVIEYAKRRTWYNPLKHGAFDFERAYARPDRVLDPAQRNRQWSGYRHVSQMGVSPPEEGAPMPFSVKPKRKLEVEDVFAILRDHYEKSPYDIGRANPHGPAEEIGARTICCSSTNHGDVFQLRSNLPVEIGALWWLAYWRPCSSPFLPLYFGVAEVPEQFDFQAAPGVYSQPENALQPENDKAIRVFRDLTIYIDRDYWKRIPNVQAAWKEFERVSFAIQPVIEQQALSNWKRDRKAVIEALSRYCQGTAAGAIQKARGMIE